MPRLMHARFRVDRPLRSPLPASVLRGVCSAVFEVRQSDDHHRPVKHHSISPVWLDDGSFPAEVFGLTFAEHVDDDEAVEHALAVLASGVRFGSASGVCIDLDVEHRTWSEMLSATPTRRVSIVFGSPTVFSRNGRPYVLPDPRIVMASVIERWDRCAAAAGAMTVPPTAAETLRDEVVLASFDGQAIGGGRKDQAGFVGSATFELRRSDAETRGWMAAVWALAEWTGVGAELAAGCGRIEVLAE